jgi:hypothetical protein
MFDIPTLSSDNSGGRGASSNASTLRMRAPVAGATEVGRPGLRDAAASNAS